VVQEDAAPILATDESKPRKREIGQVQLALGQKKQSKKARNWLKVNLCFFNNLAFIYF
jgi:hypothetical protein